MPIYNEARFLRQALDSFLAQDYADFELIISDNASQDGTQEICREYAARDSRVRYHRNEVNLGAAANFNQVFHGSTGKYFIWAAGHDLRAPSFLRLGVEALERKPEAVLCCFPTRFRDPEGRPTNRDEVFIDTCGHGVFSRYYIAVWRQSSCYAIYGLFRRSALADSRLVRPVFAPDVVLLSELALMGPFVVLPETLFYPLQEWDDLTPELRRERAERMSRDLVRGSDHRRMRFSELYHSVDLALGAWHSRASWWMKPLLAASGLVSYAGVIYRNLPSIIRVPARTLFRKTLGLRNHHLNGRGQDPK